MEIIVSALDSVWRRSRTGHSVGRPWMDPERRATSFAASGSFENRCNTGRNPLEFMSNDASVQCVLVGAGLIPGR